MSIIPFAILFLTTTAHIHVGISKITLHSDVRALQCNITPRGLLLLSSNLDIVVFLQHLNACFDATILDKSYY